MSEDRARLISERMKGVSIELTLTQILELMFYASEKNVQTLFMSFIEEKMNTTEMLSMIVQNPETIPSLVAKGCYIAMNMMPHTQQAMKDAEADDMSIYGMPYQEYLVKGLKEEEEGGEKSEG